MKYFLYCRKSSESDERQIQSIEDQLGVLIPLTRQRNLEILKTIKEAGSAKKPGRTEFSEMLNKVESGVASGILVWDPSRLSRNSVDTGRLIYLMDLGKLEEVITPSQTFRNTPNDKFMLNILCSQAKLENDNKSENVKRSLKAKAERGEYPSFAPPGYVNSSHKRQGLRDIVPHPTYFPLMKQLIHEALTGNYSINSLTKLAVKLGIRNFKDKPLSKTSMHRHLSNLFYTGEFYYNGRHYQGNHTPMISAEEFERLQIIIQGRSKPRHSKHDFPLAGELIKCGECSFGIVGEVHTKKYKSGSSQEFVYYRCSKKGRVKCSQPYIRSEELHRQVVDFLSKLEIHKDFVEWAVQTLKEAQGNKVELRQKNNQELRRQYDGVQKRVDNLISMRLSPNNINGQLITDEEFARIKSSLLIERDQINTQLKALEEDTDQWMNSVSKVFDFMCDVKLRYETGTDNQKRLIVQAIGSNLTLKNKILSIQPQKPFELVSALYSNVLSTDGKFEPKNRSTEQSFLFQNIIEYRVRESNP